MEMVVIYASKTHKELPDVSGKFVGYVVWYERQEPIKRQDDDARSDSDIDYARIIHSASFRRLQSKTQILNLGDSDFYRTRLTHSLEVAQIAGGLIKQLKMLLPDHPATADLPDHSLIQTIGSAHDIGHPPFGHGGEVALNYCMRVDQTPEKAGFEGNGQTLRILSKLEAFSKSSGANLTRRSLLGVLKYPVAYSTAANPALVPKLQDGPSTLRIIDTNASKPPKCYLDCEGSVVSWVLEPLSTDEREAFQAVEKSGDKHGSTLHKSLDCSIMDLADDISYGVHDLEDAIAMRLLTRQSFEDTVTREVCSGFLEFLTKRYARKMTNNAYDQMLEALFGESEKRKLYINMLVPYFMTELAYEDHEQFSLPLIRYRLTINEDRKQLLKALKKVVFNHVIKSPRVQQLEFKGQGMVVAVFEALQSDPKRLLPEDAFKRYDAAQGDLRVICDFVAGMTDGYLLKTYERLFAPGVGSVFDKL